MLIPFENIANEARVWVYQANRTLSLDDSKFISGQTVKFIQEWTAHNQQLHASFTLLEDLFLVLAVDEYKSQASGCSIDKSVHFIKFLEAQLNLSFTDRTKIALIRDEELLLIPFSDFKNQLKHGSDHENTQLFNTLAKTKQDITHNWRMSIADSPYARFLIKVNK
jgi:hypothetical protein